MSDPSRDTDRWAGLVVFAAVMMFLVGGSHIIAGLGVISDPESVEVGRPLLLDLEVWGWVHLFLGILIIFAGIGLYSGATWARVVGIVLATASALGAFTSLSDSPRALILIGIDVLIIWALARHGAALRVPEKGER